MQFIRKSPAINYSPTVADGALNSGPLLWTKGKLARYGNRARFYGAQITDDREMTVTRYSDLKGESIPTPIVLTMPLILDFKKAGNLTYCERCSTNRAMNIFQQNSGAGPKLWAIIQFSHQLLVKVRENAIVHPGDTSTIKTFTRYNKHLYYIVINSDSSETLHYIDLSLYNPTELINTSTASKAIVAGKTDILAGEQNFYLATENASAQEIQVYNHGSLTTPTTTWTNVFTSDSYDDYPVQMLEIDPLDIIVRKKGTQLYRIIDGLVNLLSDTLDEDLSRFRINGYGLVYVEGVDFVQTAGTSDEHKDKWYLLNDSLTLDNYLTGVVRRILLDSGVSDSEIDVSELLNIQCRGFSINGQTQMQVLQELMVLYDFSLPVINGKITAKKITDSTPVTSIDVNKIGVEVNNPPQNVLVINNEIADTDYPKQITLKYNDANNSYTKQGVIIRSQDSQSSEQKVLDYSNHSLSESIARDAAHQVFRKWYEEKSFFNVTASIYYLNELQPGSLISLPFHNQTYILKVISTTVRDIIIDVTAVKNYI